VSLSTTGEAPIVATREQPPDAPRAGWPVPVANTVAALRPRQARWAAVNLGLIGLVLLLQFVPAFEHGRPPRKVVGLFAVAAALQLADLLWLLWRRAPLPRQAGTTHFKFALAFNVLLAFALAMCSPLDDIQYGLLVLPAVVAIAFRYGLLAGICFSLATGVLSFLPLGLFIAAHPAERQSAMLQGLVLAAIYVVVAIVVDVLCGAVRDEAARLRRSLRDLRRTKNQLVAQEKLAAVGRLSAAIAHEIRNPVAMIASSLDLAAEPATPDAERRDMLRIARDESSRLTTLTNDFLAYANTKPPQRTRVCIAGALGAVASLAAARAAETGIEIRADGSPDVEADLDELQLHQALLNLTSNAIEASPPGGTVTLGGHAVDGCVDLWVENSGAAIPPDMVVRLFEPFFTTKPHGTGLGLPIARNIAVAHGGDLVLGRNATGRIRFVLHLPAHPNPTGGRN
jgi:signal transduction histidine kinase